MKTKALKHGCNLQEEPNVWYLELAKRGAQEAWHESPTMPDRDKPLDERKKTSNEQEISLRGLGKIKKKKKASLEMQKTTGIGGACL